MVDNWQTIQILCLVALLLLSGLFSGTETALISLNKFRVRHLMKKGVKNASIVHRLLERPNRLLATILIGNNLVNIAAAAIATSLAIDLFGNKGVGIATGIMTFLILVFGEITPKGYATRHAEKISLKVARPVEILVIALHPVVRILTFLTNLMIGAAGKDLKKSPFVTEEEIRTLVDVGEEEGTIEKEEKEMIEGVFEFGETTVKEILVPRVDVQCIDAGSDLDEALTIATKTRHSRFPVYEGKEDNIIGILYTKDLLDFIKENKGKKSLKDVIKPAYFVPETMKLDDLLRKFQKKKIHIALVVDEYGGIAGMVTLEDLLEEIVGDIPEEHSDVEDPLKIIDDKTAIVDAKMNIDEVNEALDIELPSDGFETVAGLIFSEIKKIPKEKEKIDVHDVSIIIEKMSGQRISKVRIIKHANDAGVS